MKKFRRASPCILALGIGAVLVPGSAAADASLTVSADAPAAWQPYDGAEIRFDVFRKGDTKFGTHSVSFDVEDDGAFTATTEVSLRAGLGPITVFRYALESEERWQEQELVGLQARTNDDGDKEEVRASLTDAGLNVDGSGFSGTAPTGIIPSSHWNIRQVFSSRILSTENGELLDTNVTKVGRETVSVGGEAIEATRYRLKSDLDVDLWYDDQGRWVQLSFEARGQQIDYRLSELY